MSTLTLFAILVSIIVVFLIGALVGYVIKSDMDDEE